MNKYVFTLIGVSVLILTTATLFYYEHRTSSPTLSTCEISNFNNQPWANNLKKVFENEMESKRGYPPVLKDGDISQGCLLEHGDTFVFISNFFEWGCGTIMKYDVKRNTLETPQNNTCASKMSTVRQDYIEFQGIVAPEGSQDGTSKVYDGQYFFHENMIQIMKESYQRIY